MILPESVDLTSLTDITYFLSDLREATTEVSMLIGSSNIPVSASQIFYLSGCCNQTSFLAPALVLIEFLLINNSNFIVFLSIWLSRFDLHNSGLCFSNELQELWIFFKLLFFLAKMKLLHFNTSRFDYNHVINFGFLNKLVFRISWCFLFSLNNFMLHYYFKNIKKLINR